MGRLIADYYGSVGFANLKPSSRTIYRIALDPVSQEHGHRLVRDMGRDHARKIVERIGATRPGAANTTRKALKVLMEYAVATNLRNEIR